MLPLARPVEALEGLLELATLNPPAMLWATNDNQVQFVAQHHTELSKGYFIPLPPWNHLRLLVDKFRLYQLAYELDIPAPKVAANLPPGGLDELGFGFPCIVKPKQSPDFFSHYGKKVHVAQNIEELKDILADARLNRLDVMISEIIPGPDDRLENFAIYRTRSGEFTAEMSAKRIRQHPIGFGMSSATVSQKIDPVTRNYTRELLAHSNFYGFAVIEWKRDERNDQPKLIEVNPRPILSQRIFVAAGINYATVISEDASGAPVTDKKYREGVYWIHDTTDISEFKRRRKLPGFSYRRFFEPYWRKPVRPVPLLEDPVPWLARATNSVRQRFCKG